MATTEKQSLLDWAGSNRATLAILITDGVGWSALGRGLRDRRMKDEVRDPHFARGDDLVSQSGGRKLKTTGDGVIAVFKNAPAALDCAIEFLANPGREDLRGRVRAIIHYGEA